MPGGDKARISVLTFGDCLISVSDGAVSAPLNLLRIATYVLLEGRGRPVHRRRIGSLIWSDHDADRAGADVRQSIARIRRFQAEHRFEFLCADAHMTWLNIKDGLYFDLADFVNLAASPGPASWVRMCQVYNGDLLDSIGTAGEGYEEWLSYQRATIRNDFITNISQAILPDTPLSRPDRYYCASRLLLVDPYHEGAHRALMSDAAASGQYSLLREVFTRCVRTLKNDLNVDPDVETIQLYQKYINKSP